LARVLEVFHTPQGAFSGQSGLASVHADARVDDSAELAPFVYVGRGSVVGPRSRLFPGVYVGEDCVLGEGCVLYPGATLMAGVKLGDGVIVHPGAVLGSDGFGYAQGPEGHVKVPQIGGLEIGDRVEIGANTAIDRGSLGTTRIETGAKLDNLCQVAHNVTVGPHSILVSQVGVSGSTKLGTGVILGGQVGVVGHLTIGDGSMVGAQAGVGKDLPPGSQVSGSPAYDHKTFLRNAALMPKLPDMAKKVRELERELAEIKASLKKGDDHDG
jgi:UDP-3-O-[3-hydroxymyristoyl] glucosamine N-acyltransferase